MNKNQEMDRLWKLIRQCDRELTAEARTCAVQHRQTEHYWKLKKDMDTLKAEYEKVKGGGTYNSLSLEHGEAHMNQATRKRLAKQSGPDTHHKLED